MRRAVWGGTVFASLLWVAGGLAAADARAQPAADAEPVEEITVVATRSERTLLEVPGAVGVVGDRDIRLARQQLSLGEALAGIPGVFTQNRNNFAQDLRIAIRGFGARANFGIRGIKLVVDGVPATLADGQGQVDSIDLASVRRIEVLRGPSASLYGGGAGGVIRIETEDGPAVPFAHLESQLGSHGFRGYAASAGGEAGALNYRMTLSRQVLDGYRDHSRMENLRFNSKLRLRLGEDSDLQVVASHVHAPVADDPGGLRASDVAADRRQASSRNTLFDAGESVDQTRVSLAYRRGSGTPHETHLLGYALWRDFENKLPFTAGGSVDLDRFVFGGSAQHEARSHWFGQEQQLLVGFEVDAQRDQRRRRDNDFGTIGARVFDQREDVTSLRAFLQETLELGADLALTLGLGFDRIEYDVDDQFLGDGDDSGRFDFAEWSPMVALRYSPRPAFNLYGKFATSFEPPTTTELANPSGGAGFNRALDPQRARSVELGVKGLLPGRVRYDLALFHIQIRDELIPIEIPSMPSRFSFTNAGRSRRSGIEAGLQVRPFRGWLASLAYTYSSFEFDAFRLDGQDFKGNTIPGVPKHQLRAEIAYRNDAGFFASWDIRTVGAVWADNANQVKSGSSVVSNLRFSYTAQFQSWDIAPFLGLQNLFDEKYTDNLRLNAGFGRFFEPAPGFSAHGGVQVTYHFGPRPGGSS